MELPQGFCKWLNLLQSCSSSSSIFPYNCLNPFNREENQTGCQESVHLKPLPKLLTKVVTLLFHETVCSPDIWVYAYAAAQVKKAMEVIPHCTGSLGPLPLSSTTFWVFFSFESLPQQYCSNMFVHALQVTHELGGENYVFWGGREGYQTLLNTDLKKELDHMVCPFFLH